MWSPTFSDSAHDIICEDVNVDYRSCASLHCLSPHCQSLSGIMAPTFAEHCFMSATWFGVSVRLLVSIAALCVRCFLSNLNGTMCDAAWLVWGVLMLVKRCAICHPGKERDYQPSRFCPWLMLVKHSSWKWFHNVIDSLSKELYWAMDASRLKLIMFLKRRTWNPFRLWSDLVLRLLY